MKCISINFYFDIDIVKRYRCIENKGGRKENENLYCIFFIYYCLLYKFVFFLK